MLIIPNPAPLEIRKLNLALVDVPKQIVERFLRAVVCCRRPHSVVSVFHVEKRQVVRQLCGPLLHCIMESILQPVQSAPDQSAQGHPELA